LIADIRVIRVELAFIHVCIFDKLVEVVEKLTIDGGFFVFREPTHIDAAEEWKKAKPEVDQHCDL